MAVTVTPQNPIGRRGVKLSFTTGQDPTYIEVPDLPVMIVVLSRTGTNQSFDVKVQKGSAAIEGSQLQVSNPQNPKTVTDTGNPWMLLCKEKLSAAIIDDSVDPPRVELTGADLTNCEVAAFKFTVLD